MDDQLDPLQKVDLAMLRAEYQKRYQAMISYIKERVGNGVEYRNAVARIIVSDTGAYCELNDLPENFYGTLGDEVEQRFLTQKQALELLNRVYTAIPSVDAENTRSFSIFALYSRRGIVDRKNCYVYEFNREQPHQPAEIGAFLPKTLPLFFKINLDSDFALNTIEVKRGIIFCLTTAGDRHIMIRIPFKGELVTDLGNLPTSNTIH